MDGSEPSALAVVAEVLAAGFDPALVARAAAPHTVLYVTDQAHLVLPGLATGRLASPGSPLGEELAAVLPHDMSPVLEEVLREVREGIRITGACTARDDDGTVLLQMEFSTTRVGEFLVWTLRPKDPLPWDRPPRTEEGTLDSLTGIANRAGIRNALLTSLAALQLGGEGFALLFVDIDGLKRINDTFGHPVGDGILRQIGVRMRGLTRGSDLVGRLGGDEFVVLWRGTTAHSDIEALHQRLIAAICEPIETHGAVLRISASAGAIVVTEATGVDPDDLLRDADAAMYEAKSNHRGGLVFFDPAMHVSVLGSLVTAGELRRAMGQNELVLFCQPVMDVFNGRTAGAEMLVRWQHPTRGLLTPDAFLAAVDASDLMEEIGAWVLDRAVEQAARWERTGDMDYFRVGVNVSPRQLTHSDVVGQLEESLRRHGTSAGNIVVEIVESAELGSRTRAAEQVRGLIDLGARVGIDDFGSGFANMTYLRDLPVDMIKVDRALIGLDPTPREEAILRAVQSIASAIGADIVLEGVERVEQLESARRCGVRFAQGYLLGRPVRPTDTRPSGHLPLPPVEG